MIRRLVGVAAALLVSAVLCTGVATAAPLVPGLPGITAGSQISVGPVPVPAASLQVCVNGTCRTTARVTALTVALRGSATLLGTPPLLLPVPCSSGVGIGVRTVPGALGAVSGSITLSTGSGTVTVPVTQSLTTTRGLSVSACTV